MKQDLWVDPKVLEGMLVKDLGGMKEEISHATTSHSQNKHLDSCLTDEMSLS